LVQCRLSRCELVFDNFAVQFSDTMASFQIPTTVGHLFNLSLV
jgi:hypothetical protein